MARGGGVCILVNDRWAPDVKILSKTCFADIYSLTIICRPFYFPSEFSSIFLTVVDITPQTNTGAAVIQLTYSRRQNILTQTGLLL